MIDEEKFRDGLELSVLIGVFLLSVISLTPDVQAGDNHVHIDQVGNCLLYTSPSPRDRG